MRRVASILQNNANEVNVMNDFVSCANSFIEMLLVHMKRIANVDKTNDPFSSEITRAHVDAVSRLVGSSGENSSSRTVSTFSCSLSSEKLDHMLIFKGKRTIRGRVHKEVKKGEYFAYGIIYSPQENEWIDETLMLEWT